MTLLFTLVPSKSIKTKKGKTYWKPTNSEARDGVLVHVKAGIYMHKPFHSSDVFKIFQIPGDLESVVESKKNSLRKFGFTLQPFIIIVGPTITEFEKIYIRIDDYSYEVPSLLKAIDICFKSFIVFDIQYPVEAEHVWYLIQWGIYGIKLNNDKNIPYIFNILNKLKAY